MSHNPFYQRSIISTQDFSKEDLRIFLDYAATWQNKLNHQSAHGKVMATCFFEPSTRTRLSFETAMKRLGGDVIGFADAKATSTSKKETLADTMRVMGDYADIMVMRHPLEGAARLAAQVTKTPIINGGDGGNQHPTQTLVDLFTIKECQGRIEGLHVAFVGDLKHGRAVQSLMKACAMFGVRMYFVAPDGFEVAQYICDELKSRGVPFSFHPELKDVMPKADIIYMTRLQRERTHSTASAFPALTSPDDLAHAKPSMRILHPLPRVEEIDPRIDATPHAYYFKQSENGVAVRKALLPCNSKPGGDTMTTLSVTSIKEGTVIDHIASGKAIFLLELLKLGTSNKQITLGLNLASSRYKTKDLIKVNGFKLSESETDQIALFSPMATVNIIHDHQVISKSQVKMPSKIEHFIVCPNAMCITNHEHTSCLFYVSHRAETWLTCHYCEKSCYLSEITHFDFAS